MSFLSQIAGDVGLRLRWVGQSGGGAQGFDQQPWKMEKHGDLTHKNGDLTMKHGQSLPWIAIETAEFGITATSTKQPGITIVPG